MLGQLDRGHGSYYSAAERVKIEQLYHRIMGRAMRPSSCPNRWADAVIEMRIFLKRNNPKEFKAMSKKYFMKRGVVLIHEGRPYSLANITDEIAKKALAANPKVAWMFESIPTEEEEPTEEESAKTVENEPEVAEVEEIPTEEEKRPKKGLKKAKK